MNMTGGGLILCPPEVPAGPENYCGYVYLTSQAALRLAFYWPWTPEAVITLLKIWSFGSFTAA
jgi:hypothetical protein